MSEPLSYLSAGVDVEAGDRAVELMRSAIAATHGPQVIGGVGGFAGLFDASELLTYRRPLLASSTDGVGTKVAIAQRMDIHDTIGIDLVGMVVDDIVVCGAKPLAMTDYIATGRVIPEMIADIVRGIATGCEATGTALVGGETAEHPGLLAEGEYDVAGAAVGVVEASRLLGPQKIREGDVLIGMASSGLHSNGYSLVRAVIERSGLSLEAYAPEFGRSLGEEILHPTRLYAKQCLSLISQLLGDVHAFSHITGGGLAANVGRVLPRGLDAVIDRSSWIVPPVFGYLRDAGVLSRMVCERTLNLGIGMVAAVSSKSAEPALAALRNLGQEAQVIGEVSSAANVDAYLATESPDTDDVVQGSKGVDGGRCVMVSDYRWTP